MTVRRDKEVLYHKITHSTFIKVVRVPLRHFVCRAVESETEFTRLITLTGDGEGSLVKRAQFSAMHSNKRSAKMHE